MPRKAPSLKHIQLRRLKQRAAKLSWHSVPRRKCTLIDPESKEYFRRHLEAFRQEIRDHYIGKFGSSHKVLAKAAPRPRGRPSRNSDHSKTVTVPYPSNSSDSEKSDIDLSDSNSSDDIYDTV